MISQLILDKILEKYGKETIYSADCVPLAAEMGVGITTVKRMFGLVSEDSPERNRTPHNSTMDIVAKWLGYQNCRALLREIGEVDISSEFTSMQEIKSAELKEGTQIQLAWIPSRVLIMTYIGNEEFLVNEVKNSKLQKGDRIRITNLVLGQELIVNEVIRDGHSLGGYRAAKDGGLTLLEIIV